MKFPENKAGLTLEQNPNRILYQSVKVWIEDHSDCAPDFESDADYNLAIQNDEIWTLQWYPETTLGFNYIAASSLEKLLKFAEGKE